MNRSVRKGLTLGELLILIIVMAFLLMILIPWLLRRRETSRTDTCVQRQTKLAQAILAFEAQHKRFPGYIEPIGKNADGSDVVGSWVVAVLPFLNREDLYQNWKQGEMASPTLAGLICPDDRSAAEGAEGPPPLSYVANCGLANDNRAATGVFQDFIVDKPILVARDDIKNHDGLATTLLTSENIQAGYWTDTEIPNVGMVWFRSPGPCNPINACRDVGTRPQDLQYARPSSFHRGVVTTSYCDGHVATLNEQIDYGIYQRLMTPDDQASGLREQPKGGP